MNVHLQGVLQINKPKATYDLLVRPFGILVHIETDQMIDPIVESCFTKLLLVIEDELDKQRNL